MIKNLRFNEDLKDFKEVFKGLGNIHFMKCGLMNKWIMKKNIRKGSAIMLLSWCIYNTLVLMHLFQL